MNIGFDGKRAFQNRTGLGNYIRVLLPLLIKYYPQHFYTLFAPKKTDLFDVQSYENVSVTIPQDFLDKKIPALWRRSGMVKDIVASEIDLYHGVSNELPNKLERTKVKKVVTVHDLIFERFPQAYSLDEQYVHRWKIKHACRIADSVIAISKQTKADLINIYKVGEEKIEVCYQSCNPIFKRVIDADEKK